MFHCTQHTRLSLSIHKGDFLRYHMSQGTLTYCVMSHRITFSIQLSCNGVDVQQTYFTFFKIGNINEYILSTYRYTTEFQEDKATLRNFKIFLSFFSLSWDLLPLVWDIVLSFQWYCFCICLFACLAHYVPSYICFMLMKQWKRFQPFTTWLCINMHHNIEQLSTLSDSVQHIILIFCPNTLLHFLSSVKNL